MCRRRSYADIASACPRQVAQFVDAVQQAVAREGLDRKCASRPSGSRSVEFEVDLDFDAGVREQPLVGRFVHDDRQQAVLQAVVAEDVGDLGADDGLETVVEQGPGRVFPGRSAADVAAGDEYAAAGDSGC